MTDFSEIQKQFIKDLFLKTNNTINEKTEEIRSELRLQVKEIIDEVGVLVNDLQQKVTELQAENKKYQQNLIQLERKVRKNNIVIYGFNEDSEINVQDSVVNLFNDSLQLNVAAPDLNNAYRIGSKNLGGPIIGEFISFQTKLSVLKNAHKLKGRNIYINEDQCHYDRENRKVLLRYKSQAKSEGKEAYIRGDKLVVEKHIRQLN